jgi:GNAT superfamily N-acetyltransferase
MEVRAAGLADVESLASIRWEFRSEMDPPTESRPVFTARMVAWLGDRMHDGRWRAWLAVDGDLAVGTVFLQLVEKLPNPVQEPEHLGYVTSLYVSPAHREQGVGERLMATALDFCRDRQVDTVVLWPSSRSVTLYGRLGFVSPGQVMELAIAAHPGRSGAGG